jgi:mono/diheme cytochrome c family protein
MEAIAFALVIAAFLVGAILLVRIARRPSPRAIDKAPPALKPGDPDDVLESDRLTKIQRWGLISSVAFAAFIAVYWLAEPGRMASTEEEFQQLSIERGEAYFHEGEKAVEEQIITGVDCARCHGEDGVGGTNLFLDPNTGERREVQVPELRGLFARYEEPPPQHLTTRDFVYFTIERGRPGTDMPTWGNQFGGPLTDQQIDDIVNYLESMQEVPEVADDADGAAIFAQFCSPCHGGSGVGGSAPAMVGGTEVQQFPEIADHIAFVTEGSQSGVPYGTSGQGTGAMPGWGTQLTEEQIRAVVEYERSL